MGIMGGIIPLLFIITIIHFFLLSEVYGEPVIIDDDYIVEKFVDLLEGQLADKGVTIELSNSAKTWFAKKGFEPAYGARPLARVIQEYLKKPLAEELLFGELIEGGHIRVDVNNKKIVLEKSKPTKLKKRKKIKT